MMIRLTSSSHHQFVFGFVLMVYLSNSRNLQILRRQNAVSTFLLRGFHNFLNLPISKTRAGWSGDLSKQQLLCIITIFVSYTLPLSHLRLDASFCIIFSLKVEKKQLTSPSTTLHHHNLLFSASIPLLNCLNLDWMSSENRPDAPFCASMHPLAWIGSI